MSDKTIILEFSDDVFNERRGVLLNSHWESAYGCFMMLVSCEDGGVTTLRSDALGLKSIWIDDSEVIFVNNGGDDEDEDD
jgi:hypothetical protein